MDVISEAKVGIYSSMNVVPDLSQTHPYLTLRSNTMFETV